MAKMSEAEIRSGLEQASNWTQAGEAIQRTFTFQNFVESMAFVNRVADHAEDVQHHPDIMIRWNKVTLTLSTHDAGGITEKDFDFAKFADGAE